MNTVIVVAGGSGTRMNTPLKKQYLLLGGTPVLQRTLDIFFYNNSIDRVCLVVPQEDIPYCNDNILSKYNFDKKITITAGGTDRQESAYNGLCSYDDHSDEDIIIVHDGVRPLIEKEEIDACINNAEKFGAAIIGIPAFDTIKKVDSAKNIEKTIDRETIWLAQTPQAFKYKLLIKAFNYAIKNNISGTDDASLVEFIGEKIKVIEGRRSNIKITTKEDMAVAEALIKY